MSFLIFSYWRSDPEIEKLIFCNGVVLSKKQCVRGFGDWIDSIMEFSQSLHRMKLDVSSFSCLTTLVIITGKHLTPAHTTLYGIHILSCLPNSVNGDIMLKLLQYSEAVENSVVVFSFSDDRKSFTDTCLMYTLLYTEKIIIGQKKVFKSSEKHLNSQFVNQNWDWKSSVNLYDQCLFPD